MLGHCGVALLLLHPTFAAPPCKAMDEQPLEAQQFIKGAQGKGLGSHEWTCNWCSWKVVATSITKLRHHLGISTQVRKCTSKGQVFVAVRDQLLGVQQQQLAAAAVRATAAAAVSAAAAAAGPTPADRQGGLYCPCHPSPFGKADKT